MLSDRLLWTFCRRKNHKMIESIQRFIMLSTIGLDYEESWHFWLVETV